MIEDVECPYCFGEGQWPEGPGYVTCHKCHGEGTFPFDHKNEIEDFIGGVQVTPSHSKAA